MGVANVWSTPTIAPAFFAIAAIAAMSKILSIGFDGVSSQSIRVFGRIASRTFAGSLRSMNVASRPNCFITLSKMRNVPP